MAPQTRKSSARAAMKFPSLISWDLAFLAESVVVPFFLPVLSECPATLFHMCISISLEKLSMICAWLNKTPSRVALASGACQKSGALGFQPASKTEQTVAEIGPVAWFQRLGSFARVGAFFPQTLRSRRLVSTLKTLHMVIHSLICSTHMASCGTRFSPKNHATVEMAHARVLPITVPILRFLHIALTCAVDAPCGVWHRLEQVACLSS